MNDQRFVCVKCNKEFLRGGWIDEPPDALILCLLCKQRSDIIEGMNYRRAIPPAVFKRSYQDPVVRYWVDAWQAGKCGWEECLVSMACSLSQQNAVLRSDLAKERLHAPPAPVIIKVDKE